MQKDRGGFEMNLGELVDLRDRISGCISYGEELIKAKGYTGDLSKFKKCLKQRRKDLQEVKREIKKQRAEL
jgi:hypothetical protein